MEGHPNLVNRLNMMNTRANRIILENVVENKDILLKNYEFGPKPKEMARVNHQGNTRKLLH